MPRYCAIVAVCVAAISAPGLWGGALAAPVPIVGEDGSLDINSGETESDSYLRAKCAPGGEVEFKVGAVFGAGRGKREPVTAKLSSGGKSVTLSGISVDSPDAEMTGGTELLTKLKPDHPVFAMLLSGRKIQFVSGTKRGDFTLNKRSVSALNTLLTRCGRR